MGPPGRHASEDDEEQLLAMHTRGVTRPMALDELERAEQAEEAPDDEAHGEGPDLPERHHAQTIWIPWALVLLGIWTALAPVTFGYLDPARWALPSGGRGVWFSDATHDELRAWLLVWSDVASGLLLVALGWRMLRPDRPRSWWAACAVGTWLVFAPVVLWSPSAAAFYGDSTVGLLVIALTILIPGMPNMARFMQMGPATPPGWSYNPSSWSQRSVLIALGFGGLVVSRYLAAYQLGYVDQLWDPFFGFAGGTQPVLDSQMSHTWPISDAGLGTIAYSFEFLMGFMGSPARWRTMPWMVALFGILVIPLGLSHIALVMSQPVVVHHWCTFCLAAAALMLPMIPLEVDEVVAMLQHLRRARRRGDRAGSLWKVFWLGGSGDDSEPDERTPPITDAHDHPGAVLRASVWGFSAPLTLVVSAVLGVGLLAAPAVFDVAITSGAADVAHLGGAAVLVVSVVAMGEVVRPVRLLNVAVGLGVAGVVLLTAPPVGYGVAVVLTGVLVAALAPRRGRITERYGTYDRVIV